MKQKLLNLYFSFFALLAKNYIKKYNPYIIWITWSIWKTSSRMIINEILQKYLNDKIVYTSKKNFNWELGLSLSILWISDYEPKILWVLKTIINSLKISLFWKKLYDIVILEYWIDHIWEMDFLLSIAKPDISLITKIDKVHSSQFESKEIIAKEKYKLALNTTKIVFLNYDDEFAFKYQNEIKCEKYFYTTNIALNNEKIDLKWKNYDLKLIENIIKTSFSLYLQNLKKINITSNLVWEENIWYINIWFLILEKLFFKFYNLSFFKENFDKTLDINSILQYSRFSLFDWIEDSILIDSSYNRAPESMKKVIDNFFKISSSIFPKYKTILCLGEMRELWDYTKDEHEKLANFIENKSQEIFIVWDSMKKYFLPINKKAKHFKNSKILWEFLKKFLSKTEEKYLILFKWSQNTIFMEEALKQILKNYVDKQKICRQEDFWIEKKEKFFLK